jgi:hypothetical protein
MGLQAGRSATVGGMLAALLLTATRAWAEVSDPTTTATSSSEAALSADAAPERLADPAAPQALGRVYAAGPTPPALFLMSSGGYGYTESVLNTGDVHHRAAGSLAVEGRPASWLGLGLRLDGRYDRHQGGPQGSDSGWIGDPRVFMRVDGAVGPSLRAGARLGLWLPGGAAPSVDFAAVTPELSGLLTWAPRGTPLWLTANGGYRLNRSARTASDAGLLSASDRLALELSAFDQVLMGLAATYGGGRAQGFVEVTAELMVGAGSPSPSSSPLRAGGGIRLALSGDVRLEAEVEAALGPRPDVAAAGPLVPVPPRAAVWLGVAYRFGAPSAVGAAPRRPAPPPAAVAPRPAIAAATLDGRIIAADGATLSEPQVAIRTGAGVEPAAVDVDADGRFTFSGKAGQTLTVEAKAAGHEPSTGTATLTAGSAAELTLTLRRRLPSGQIRGLVRSFKGVGLDAEIKIDPSDPSLPTLRTLHTEDGRFEVDVAPGTYELTISAPGYEKQRRRVEVEQNGVTLLNADLRSAR